MANWASRRRIVLERDGYKCVICGIAVQSADGDVHHLLPRSSGGSDDLSNLVTLCDGCHASLHPKLAGKLARRWLERWALRLAKWLDRTGTLSESIGNFGPALRLFGMNRFREGQLPIVLAALAGKSVLVVSPTGSGKTICFQLPSVLRSGVAIVVTPLKTLMTDQVSALLRKKIPSTFINSDISYEEKSTRFALLRQGAIKLLYLAPERFFVRSEFERQQLKQSKPSFLVVDEAHCVDQWGRDFRREYGGLNEVREKLGSPPVLAFTATAGKDMQKRILASLGIPNATVFVRDVDRPNISLLRWRCEQSKRAQEIASLLALPTHHGQRAMVFVPSAKVGQDLQAELAGLGVQVPFYHSKLGTSWEREQLLKRFTGESLPFANQIICTNAFGMGLDIPDVRTVIHWQQPASVEDLMQEIGRAGRDRRPSVSVIFHDDRNQDQHRLKFMAEKTVEGASLEKDRSTLLDHRYGQIEQVAIMLRLRACFRNSVRRYFGQASAPAHTPLSMRILSWVFSERQQSIKQLGCCDFCDASAIRKLGKLRYVESRLSERFTNER